jgi:hypothetical protein
MEVLGAQSIATNTDDADQLGFLAAQAWRSDSCPPTSCADTASTSHSRFSCRNATTERVRPSQRRRPSHRRPWAGALLDDVDEDGNRRRAGRRPSTQITQPLSGMVFTVSTKRSSQETPRSTFNWARSLNANRQDRRRADTRCGTETQPRVGGLRGAATPRSSHDIHRYRTRHRTRPGALPKSRATYWSEVMPAICEAPQPLAARPSGHPVKERSAYRRIADRSVAYSFSSPLSSSATATACFFGALMVQLGPTTSR